MKKYAGRHIEFLTLGFLAMLVIASFFQCAHPVSPTGGDKDEFPPKLDSARSTPNYQTRFQKKDIYFGFDEWVVVVNPFSQVIISPP